MQKLILGLIAIVGMTMQVEASVTKAEFGKLPDGTVVEIYTLKSAKLEVRVMSWGARLVSVKSADKNGKMADVSLGYDKLEEWLKDKTHFGGVVGRYGNRLAKGQFTIDGHTYQVPINNGPNALHGGPKGFDTQPWRAKQVADGVELTLVSPDGEMGFPGTLTVHVTYTVKDADLHIAYKLSSDKATVVNVTNHAYWNLRGDDAGRDILDTRVTINADHFIPTDAGLIPTGEIAPVAGTPMDFRTEHVIGERIEEKTEQLISAWGYDHTWVVNGQPGVLRLAAEAYDPLSGRTMTVKTTEPGVQFYTGNHLTGEFTGRHGVQYVKRMGFCFETQHYPDSPNHANFPSTLLKPGEVRTSETVYSFGVK